jgi:hypothetical protein
MQEWNEFSAVGKWTASVTLYKDGEEVQTLELDHVLVVETGVGDLDPETGLPVEDAEHRLSLSGVIRERG